MERILILGSAGSGKSTLARQLGERLQIEVIHLDRYWWRSGWQMTPQEVFLEKVLAFIEGERWIMDGNYLPACLCALQLLIQRFFWICPGSCACGASSCDISSTAKFPDPICRLDVLRG